VHLDGYNQLPYLTGQQDKSERKAFIYFDDDGHLVALRFDDWKLVFAAEDARHIAHLGSAIHFPS
jgi:arylsulfatase A-like enzyme